MSENIRLDKLIPKGERYLLTVSHRSEPLWLPAELVYRHNLKEGTVITPAQWGQLESEMAQLDCRAEINRMLGAREHALAEVRMKLRKRGFANGVIEKEVLAFVRSGLIDDRRLAHQLVVRAFERKPAGRSFLTALLQRKSIPRGIAEEAVASFLREKDETATALAALRSKWSQIGQLEVESARRKAYTYLSRRGISYEAARTAFDTLYTRSHEVSDSEDS